MAQLRLIYDGSNFGVKPVGFEYPVQVQNKMQNRSQEMVGSITFNNSVSYQAARLAGLGIIRAPELDHRLKMELGRFVEVLSDQTAEPMPIAAILLSAPKHSWYGWKT